MAKTLGKTKAGNPRKRSARKNEGRPLYQIDWKAFDKLCAWQCTEEEIAFFFGIDADTVAACVKRDKGKSFSEYYKSKKGNGRISIRGKQYQKALEGNVTMLIWLGKQVLGQTDKVETKNENRHSGLSDFINALKADAAIMNNVDNIDSTGKNSDGV